MKIGARRLTATLMVLALLPWVIPPAQAAVTAGATDALVVPEQRIRDNSSAIPVFGFSMQSDAGDALDNITVTFAGTIYTADNLTLYTLNVNGAISGVGLYRDDGATDDVLDSGDTALFVDSIFWSGASVRMVMTSHGEALPVTTTGSYTWFIVLRTAANGNWLGDGFAFQAYISTGAIVATDGAGYASQPASTVTTNAMIVRQTRAFNLVNSTNNYIGQAQVAVHERAPLGLRIIDGNDAADGGIDDRLTSIDLRLTQAAGAVNSFDFAPITTDGATSGLAVYRDDGTDDDIFDAGDTPITLGSISPTVFPVGGVNFRLTFSPPESIPHDTTGAVSFLFVVRTGLIVTGDALRLNVVLGSAHTMGVLPEDGDRRTNSQTNATSGIIYGDNTPPEFWDFYWSAISTGYLTTQGDRLWFNHQMPGPMTGTANAYLYDGNSGLDRILWSPESGPMSGPNPLTSSFPAGTGSTTSQATFDFDSTSSDSSSPVDAAVYDRVGNMASAVGVGYELTYTYTEDDLVVDDAPGWYSWSGSGLWIDDNGTLWFSDQIYGSSWAYLGAGATSLYGGGLARVNASEEPNLGGTGTVTDTYTPGTISTTFYTAYEFLPNSTRGSGAVTITAWDQSGNSQDRDFQIREDTTGPMVTVLEPIGGSIGSDILRFRARVTDAGSGVSEVWVEQLPDGWDYSMFQTSDDEWFVDFMTTHLTDGPNRFTVFAIDNVDNEGSASVEVVIDNTDIDATGPQVALVAPIGGAFLSGSALVQVTAQDPSGVASTWVRVGQGAWMAAAWNAASGFYELSWDTSGVPDGEYEISVMARDTWGNSGATAPVRVTVDNHAPTISINGPAPDQTLAGVYSIRIFADDEVGVDSVTVTVGGRTVDVAYNPSTGYYEYSVDTRSWPDGAYSVSASVTDASGKESSSVSVAFKVKNVPDPDMWRSIRESANFLFLMFVVLAFVVVMALAKRGTLSSWLGRGGGGGGGGGSSGGAMASGAKPDDKEPPKSA